ncbi:hypothetical protein BOV90_06415 [Solemya velum gill symbiont]|nr:hypothetical protein BOV90_06415 [Solemya velum gill symbiont]OOY44575.1 hypothetical protein BOV91_00995 [Solemya velum gill symbiont]OOY44780.1 hypothetical protein BOV92_07900 [Solemya velum gill symbiont]OOY46427.1 hypothetical protein BOV93_10155 [Solemya velum gill symbiont]OOY50250.1 hypothetical protein BOV97_11515 [Solemya velum gill symbiont]
MGDNSMKKILIAFLLLISPVAMAAQPVEGVNYSVIGMDSSGKEKIQVIEFFWYACPHCYAFEPAVKEWLKTKADDVEFVRYPATFNRPNVQMHAKTFFALEQMGKPELHDVIMSAMHDRKQRLNTQETMDQFLASHGVDLNAYHDMMDSFVVNLKMQEAVKYAKQYQITGVPALIVDGQYKVEQAYSWAQKFTIADYLVSKIRAERAAMAK